MLRTRCLLQDIKSVDPKGILTLLHRIVEYFQAPMLAAHRKNRMVPNYVAQMVTVLVAKLPASRRCLSSAASSHKKCVLQWASALSLSVRSSIVVPLHGLEPRQAQNRKPSTPQASGPDPVSVPWWLQVAARMVPCV